MTASISIRYIWRGQHPTFPAAGEEVLLYHPASYQGAS